VLLAIAAGGWLSLRRDPALATFDFGSDPGPLLVPRLLLAALAIGGAALAGHGAWRRWRPRPGAGEAAAAPARRGVLWPLAFVAALLAYQRLLPVAGYPAATLAFSAAWILLLTWRRGALTPRSAALGLLAAGLITGAIYVVFKGLVRVPLP
jgi:hypothetical protein